MIKSFHNKITWGNAKVGVRFNAGVMEKMSINKLQGKFSIFHPRPYCLMFLCLSDYGNHFWNWSSVEREGCSWQCWNKLQCKHMGHVRTVDSHPPKVLPPPRTGPDFYFNCLTTYGLDPYRDRPFFKGVRSLLFNWKRSRRHQTHQTPLKISRN